jgi:hypothetical protein
MRREALLLLLLAGPAAAQDEAPVEAEAPEAPVEAAPVDEGPVDEAPVEAPAEETPPDDAEAEPAPALDAAPQGPAAEMPVASVEQDAPFAADWRLTLRGGVTWVLDDAFDAVAATPVTGGGEIGADRRLTDSIWVGASWSARGGVGDVYENIDTGWSGMSLRASVAWHHDLLPWLDLYGRAGPSVWWYDLTLTPSDGTESRSDAFSFGAHAGLGVDLYLLHPELVQESLGGLAVGLSLEATWDQVLPVELGDGGTSYGDLDPSGPGFLIGFTLQF